MGKKNCSNCIKGTEIIVNGDILCRYKGAVSPEYVCSKHKNAPYNQNYIIKSHRCYECEFFTLYSTDYTLMEQIGSCQLFTVRKYDGREKKACSKFSAKSQLEVS